MKLDNQSKLQIPIFVRKEKKYLPGDKLWILMTEENKILLSKETKGVVLGCVKMDSKGRISIPSKIREKFHKKEVFFSLCEEENVGLILKDVP